MRESEGSKRKKKIEVAENREAPRTGGETILKLGEAFWRRKKKRSGTRKRERVAR